ICEDLPAAPRRSPPRDQRRCRVGNRLWRRLFEPRTFQRALSRALRYDPAGVSGERARPRGVGEGNRMNLAQAIEKPRQSFAALSVFLMPLSQVLLMSAVLLWALDASLNITMEPFRAFVGDMLRKDQHTTGYAVQTAFIGAGAVLGSLIPPALDRWGIANVAPGGGIPDTVRYAFWIGGAALLIAVLWTVLTTREYSPED